MKVKVTKWGNSLAVRIPADGDICLQPKNWDRAAFIKEMKLARQQMQEGSSVIEELRRGGSY
jgi:hypothetical protein